MLKTSDSYSCKIIGIRIHIQAGNPHRTQRHLVAKCITTVAHIVTCFNAKLVGKQNDNDNDANCLHTVKQKQIRNCIYFNYNELEMQQRMQRWNTQQYTMQYSIVQYEKLPYCYTLLHQFMQWMLLSPLKRVQIIIFS